MWNMIREDGALYQMVRQTLAAGRRYGEIHRGFGFRLAPPVSRKGQKGEYDPTGPPYYRGCIVGSTPRILYDGRVAGHRRPADSHIR